MPPLKFKRAVRRRSTPSSPGRRRLGSPGSFCRYLRASTAALTAATPSPMGPPNRAQPTILAPGEISSPVRARYIVDKTGMCCRGLIISSKSPNVIPSLPKNDELVSSPTLWSDMSYRSSGRRNFGCILRYRNGSAGAGQNRFDHGQLLHGFECKSSAMPGRGLLQMVSGSGSEERRRDWQILPRARANLAARIVPRGAARKDVRRARPWSVNIACYDHWTGKRAECAP